jgi:formylmethanofuran dehydrogenase subunit B
MSALEPSPARDAAPWTCPFCPLLCDAFGVVSAAGAWSLTGSDCARARAGLARFGPGAAPAASPQIDGVACDPAAAIAAAARLLSASRQPLFGGLGTDAAGARALYPLACRTGAICDAAGGEALTQGLRALQDRGGFTTTLAEVQARADLIVCIGSLPSERYPEFLRRCGFGQSDAAAVWVLLPAAAPTPSALPAGVEIVRFDGDLFDAAAMLAACLAGRAVGDAAGAIAPLAARLHAARYAVLAYETAQLPAQGALVIEAINRSVATLNQRTRAAALPLGGADGASTVNAVFTWLSGLPLRSRAAPLGLEHEPLRFGADRLLAGGGVDALLWIASFGSEPAPPAVELPRIVLGHPVFAAASQSRDTVFIPVATPGIGSAGHLFRTDGSVLMPLRALRDDGLPTVAAVLQQLNRALQGATA